MSTMTEAPSRNELAAEDLAEEIEEARCIFHAEMVVDEIAEDHIRLACPAKGCREVKFL